MRWVKCRDVVTPGLAVERLVGDDNVTYGSYGPSSARSGMWYATNVRSSTDIFAYFDTQQEARDFLMLEAVLMKMEK